MTHGSLFSGIGGFDLAAEWMGWENVFHCEWMPFPRQVLKYHFPNSISYEDITKTDFTIHKGTIGLLSGGFPCQPYSSAGKRLGKEDSRHLWPEMLRAIHEIEPTYIVGENVRGLTNWNGGVVFEEVCADLENCGYEIQPVLLPACSIGAPHRRDRIWFVAYSSSNGHKNRCEKAGRKNGSSESGGVQQFKGVGSEWDATDTNITRCENRSKQHRGKQAQGREGEYCTCRYCHRIITNSKSIRQKYALENGKLEGRRFRKPNQRNAWDSFPSQSPICGGNDGIPTRLDNITIPKWRTESIKGYGNAIVPQLAYQIFKVIQKMENDYTNNTRNTQPI